jgi:hypothetical protein
MRTLMLFLFFGCLAILMYCAGAARWIISITRPALLRPRVGAQAPHEIHDPRYGAFAHGGFND